MNLIKSIMRIRRHPIRTAAILGPTLGLIHEMSWLDPQVVAALTAALAAYAGTSVSMVVFKKPKLPKLTL